MTYEEKRLLVAIGDYLEWRIEPRGFVKEPLFNLAESYITYLKSLGKLPWPTAIENFERHFGSKLQELAVNYQQ